MTTKLTRVGEELAVVLPEALAAKLGTHENTPLEFATNGQVLIIAPAGTEERRRKFLDAVRETDRKYGGAFKILADS